MIIITHHILTIGSITQTWYMELSDILPLFHPQNLLKSQAVSSASGVNGIKNNLVSNILKH